MKNLLTVLVIMFLTTGAGAQYVDLYTTPGTSPSKPKANLLGGPVFSVDMTAGTRLLQMNNASADYASRGADLSFGYGIRYMFHKHSSVPVFSSLGIGFGGALDKITSEKQDGSGLTVSNLSRFTAHGYLNFTDFFDDTGIFNLYFHVGSGVAYLSNNDAAAVDGTDRMTCMVYGFMPALQVHPNIAIIANFSFITLDRMDRGVEMREYLSGAPGNKQQDYFMNFRVGVSFGI